MALSVEDQLKLYRLYADYIQNFDRGDRDGWLSLFTDDVVYRVVPRNETGEWAAPIDLVGHDALSEYWDYRQDTYDGHGRHFSTDVRFDGEGDRATGSAHSMVVLAVGDAPRIRITGYIDDDLVRDAGGVWRFASRTAYPDL